MDLFIGIFILCLASAYADVQIYIEPPSYAPGVTGQVSINCTFPVGSEANMATVLSIIMSKADSVNASVWTEVASINAFDSGHPVDYTNGTGVADGHMGLFHDAYLSLTFSNPDASVAGYYHCAANGMDNVGHPVEFAKTAQVTTYDGSGGSCSCSGVQAQIDDLVNRVTSLEKSKMTLFDESKVHNGHRYLLSKGYWRNADVAESMCELFNGYLAEIDDSAEFQFIKSFLQPFSEVGSVLVGANDEYGEGMWEFRNSHLPMVFADWYQTEPDTPTNDCMVLYRFHSWQMSDFACYNSEVEYQRNFLCEVPV